MTFEEKTKRLDEIVQILEMGEPTLQQINELFVEGVELSKSCFDELNQTKGKVTILQQELTKLLEKPFEN